MGTLANSGVAHIIVDDLSNVMFAEEDKHHLVVVRRLRTGEKVTLGDGMGSWCGAEIVASVKARRDIQFEVEITSEIFTEKRFEPPIEIGFIVPSLDRASWAIQKMAELGVDKIYLLESERSSVRSDGLSLDGREFTKLRRVIREAAMQSKSPFLSELIPLMSLEDFRIAHPMCVLCTVGGNMPLQLGVPVIVGPEGGFSPSEEARFEQKVSLGRNVLRSETAAIAVASVLSLGRQGIN